MKKYMAMPKTPAQKLREYLLEKYKLKNPFWKCEGKQQNKCICCAKLKSSIFYTWTSMVTRNALGIVCEPCMIKERFGRKYKSNKAYQRWINERNSKKSNRRDK